MIISISEWDLLDTILFFYLIVHVLSAQYIHNLLATEKDLTHVYCNVFVCISYVYMILFSFCQSDESDENSEEESATDNGEKCLSDGKKKVHFCIPRKCKKWNSQYHYKF